MMVSPDYFAEQQSDKTYEELLLIRDEVIESIRSFEEDPHQDNGIMPGPDVIYQWNLEYLGKLCELIVEKFRQEYVWGEGEKDLELDESRIAAYFQQHIGEYITSYQLVEKAGAYVGDMSKLGTSELFALDDMVFGIAEEYGFTLNNEHHNGLEEGVPWCLDFKIEKKDIAQACSNNNEMKKIYGADLDPNDEWALLKQWEKEAIEELAEEEASHKETSKE